ncbi:dipeptidase [bacterium]|nr:dipeptidase [bacterium]
MKILLGHNDVLLRLERNGDHLPFLLGDESAQVDLPKARQGGLGGGFFACWVPRDLHGPDPDEETLATDDGGYLTSLADPLEPEYACEITLSMTNRLWQLENDSMGGLAVVGSTEQLLTCLDEDVFAAILHFEGAEAIDTDLSNLDEFYGLGLRSLGLVWSRPNLFGHGVQFAFPSSPDTGPGLTRAGRELVKACNQLGIMLDVSHLTAQGFWDLARYSRHPLVATHSNAHALCPSSRNLTDDQLQAIADSGGLVAVNFCVSDLRSDGEEDADTPLELIFDQVEYIAELIGIEHVAIGSDFEGALMPDELSDVSDLGLVLEGLAERGFDEDDLDRVASGNWLRVLAETWQD